jgi:hypothetical protein
MPFCRAISLSFRRLWGCSVAAHRRAVLVVAALVALAPRASAGTAAGWRLAQQGGSAHVRTGSDTLRRGDSIAVASRMSSMRDWVDSAAVSLPARAASHWSARHGALPAAASLLPATALLGAVLFAFGSVIRGRAS